MLKFLSYLRHLPPSGLVLGAGSILSRPNCVQGARHVRIGARTRIGAGAYIAAITSHAGESFDPCVRIGDDIYIGSHFHLASVSKVEIGDGCVLSDYVYMADVAHGLDPAAGPIMAQPLVRAGDIVIGRSSFVGYRASILPGVTLGQHCVVGAGSVVTKSFPDYSMVASNPARLIKRYDPAARTWVKP
ncbi:MAG: hypothetical protein IPP47_33480 [Bryobacterales bacterium]|nr:hypothetical protein [Bryobacterales bacterium]